ncbi:MAG: acetyl-CoA carboxylase biotin carboxyl carrier protein subunit [Desulfohalobiaceae bacterium]|nr:acetyl-CoA carboxylase biotin carboxyl carrier protein subunit [Desulfohalobiaceae bacterium]
MPEEITAPLAGNVWNILVNVGDTVEEDDEVLVLEAMKMENSVYSSADGTVKEIKVKQGDAVEEDDVLIVIE